MVRIYGYIVLLLFIMFFTCCNDEWEDHFGNPDTSINVMIWDTLETTEKYSEFMKYLKLSNLDSVIKSTATKTLFIPANEAFSEYLEGKEDTTGISEIIKYHITPTLFMIRNVDDNRKLRTLSEKFSLIRNFNNSFKIDEVDIIYSSPLYLNGKYYEVSEVLEPNPNIYEYLKSNSPAIQKFIDTRDTIILNKEESTPIGYNERGQTIYDSVTTVGNLFEEEYFAVSKESRNFSATLIVPNQSTYENALDEMAGNLSASYTSHEDIPVAWQNEVLIPILLNKGTYGGLLDPGDFLQEEKKANIKGDSILVDFTIDPNSLVLCSNGLVYDYASFSVGDSLYLENIVEAESFVDSIGLGRFTWKDKNVTIDGNMSFMPVKQVVKGFASKDTTVNISFDNNYSNNYSVTFTMKNVFPNNYRLVWRTNYRTTGIYAIYVNGEKVKLGLEEYEAYDTRNLINGFFSVQGFKLYADNRGFCTVDGWVNNISEFGDVKIKFEYLGPGISSDNGLHIDYVALLPK
jgi:hypothetical protein